MYIVCKKKVPLPFYDDLKFALINCLCILSLSLSHTHTHHYCNSVIIADSKPEGHSIVLYEPQMPPQGKA